MPGMDGFDADAVVVQRNPMSGGATTAGERKGPAGVIPKVGGELQGAYEPFKPPETYEAAKVSEDENDPERMMMLMRQRAGMWFTLAKFIRPLQAKGMTSTDIFDATGIEPKEQATWVVWLQCYASLKEGLDFDSTKLEYFHDEYRGAPNLSQIMYMPAATRAAAATFVVDNEFEETQTRELVKAYEIKSANVRTVAARDFNDTPGDILAYKLYRDILELQRYQGEEEALKIFERGMLYAVTEKAKARMATAVELFKRTKLGEGGSLANGESDEGAREAELQVVRLEEAEFLFIPMPVIGNLNKVTAAKVRTAGVLEDTGNIFGVFSPQANTDWVALPKWDLLLQAVAPFALFIDDTSKTDIEGVKDKAEPGLLISDKSDNSPRFGQYYLVAKTSSLVLAGSNAAAETVSVMDGKDILQSERDGKKINTLARVLLCVRAPSRGGDGMSAEFVG